MKKQIPTKAYPQRYSKILQDYQILFTSIVTYWIALIVGLIIAYVNERFVFNVFFVSVIGISAYFTILGIFYLLDFKEELEEIVQEIEKE